MCVLAKDCNEAVYVRLVEGLCNEHQIKLLKVKTVCGTYATTSQSAALNHFLFDVGESQLGYRMRKLLLVLCAARDEL